MTTPAVDFTLFPKLAPELRREVWKQCLPCRILERNPPSNYGHLHCELQQTTDLNTRHPIVTRVCRESREVAFEYGDVLKHNHDDESDSSDSRPLPDYLKEHWERFGVRRWFSPSRDIFHLSWDGDTDMTAGLLYPLTEFLDDAEKRSERKEVSIMAEIIMSGYSGKNPSVWANPYFNELDKLDRGKIYLYTLDVVNLHISFDQAAKSELFGRLVEERVKLIDARDEDMIAKYHQLYLSGPQEDLHPFEIFRQLLSDFDRHRENLKYRREVLETRWVRNKWVGIRNKKFLHLEDPDQLFLELTDEKGCPSHVWKNGYPPGNDIVIRPVVNKDHPWVKKILEDMPKFSPVIMFRFCEEKCYLHKGEVPPRPRRMAINPGRGRGRGRGS